MDSVFSFATPPAPWMLAVIALLVVGAVIDYGPRRRNHPMPKAARVACFVLRMVGLAGVTAAIVGLSQPRVEDKQALRRLVVIADNTQSMGVVDASSPGESPTPRAERAEVAWRDRASFEAWRAAEGIQLEVVPLDPTSEGLVFDAEAPFATPKGLHSDLTGSIEAITGDGKVLPLAAIVVVSDGLQHGEQDEVLRRLLEAGRRSGVPVSSVSAGAPAIMDAAVTSIRTGDFAFVENTLLVEVTIESVGLDGAETELELRLDTELVERRRVRLSGDTATEKIDFEFVPDKIGQFIFSARLTPLDQEATPDNNEAIHVVKILRDRVRALHVAGRPDWDVRALRTLLRSDPNVELLSYYILRDFDDISRSLSNERMSLIPFPVDELFMTKLDTFDIIIMQNFDAETHGRYLANIEDFVIGGGALIIIGGDLGLPTGDFAPLGEILPIRTTSSAPLVRAPFRPKSTEHTERHPVTEWLADSGWAQLPALDAYNEAAFQEISARKDTSFTELLRHPTATTAQGDPVTLLAVGLAGKGRTMVLTSPSTWRLGFSGELDADSAGGRPFDQLWRSSLRWLLQDESEERLSLEANSTRFAPGADLTLRVEALSESYLPTPETSIDWSIRGLDDDVEIEAGALTTGPDGAGVIRLSAPEPEGNYVATARFSGADEALPSTSARRVFRVTRSSKELYPLDARLGSPHLRALARETNGAWHDLSETPGFPSQVPLAPQQSRSLRRADMQPVWPSPWALLLMLVGLCGEWLLRRRLGAA